jgi:hypothetical protein
MKMTDRERAIKAIRRGTPLGEHVKCACFSEPPTRKNRCFGVCEDTVAAVIESFEEIRSEVLDLTFTSPPGKS